MSNENDTQNNTTAQTQDAAAAESTPQKSELDLAKDDVQKWKNEYLYLRAEFDNYKKNTLKERSDLLKFGAERIARDILDVMDNFERALQTKTTPELFQNFRAGVEMTAKELKEALLKHGISEIPSEGQPFSPLHHEAISSEPTLSIPDGHVARVFKKPYKLHDKVIRMGQVIVATKPKGDN